MAQSMPPGEAARPSHFLRRHRELLHEYESEFRKIRSNMEEQREREELLGSVRADIGEYRTAASARMESLVRERGASQNSVRTTDQILAGAAATYDALRSQVLSPYHMKHHIPCEFQKRPMSEMFSCFPFLAHLPGQQTVGDFADVGPCNFMHGFHIIYILHVYYMYVYTVDMYVYTVVRLYVCI